MNILFAGAILVIMAIVSIFTYSITKSNIKNSIRIKIINLPLDLYLRRQLLKIIDE